MFPRRKRGGGVGGPGRHLVAYCAAIAVLTAGLQAAAASTTSHAQTAGAAPSRPAPSTLGELNGTVTLITGDTVEYHDAGGGRITFDVEPAPRADGAAVTFSGSGDAEHFYVTPSDAEAHLRDGTLDRGLFDIPGLIRAGYDDNAADELPVIVTFEDDRGPKRLARQADALPVDAVNGAGVSVDRAAADEFWGRVTADGDVEQVLLDRTYEVTLDESVPQISAPEAWETGYTGEGVTVAVLDTGVDADHPDLSGRVVDAENFTDEVDTDDRHGHGTHVASTIAGSGAASDGRYTGVAPDADLLIGKVCFLDTGDRGSCPTSSILAGMDWAAANGADIVNMSLGGAPTDGTDLLSQAVNFYTEATGTLFVVSAGNTGGSAVDPFHVGSPGVADAALTVGAVDKGDQLASFSSRGPRGGDYAVKPELTAPGVDITAASPGGGHQSMDGTSMAAPHVAGAAALLLQARPDLEAEALKDALASTAVDGGYAPFEQGTGRVDVARAIDSGVYGPDSIDFGDLDEPAERELTYTNHTDAPVTLELGVALTDLGGDPADGLTLPADTVTVPAHGQASLTATADPGASGEGVFNGIVTAAGDGVDLRTAAGFGFVVEHTLTVDVLDHTGAPACGRCTLPMLVLQDSFDPAAPIGLPEYWLSTSGGRATAEVPPGVYTVLTQVRDADRTRLTHLIELEVKVEGDTAITLDAREGVRLIAPEVPRSRVQARTFVHSLCREKPVGGNFCFVGLDRSGNVDLGTRTPYDVYVTPTGAGELARLYLWERWTLAQPRELEETPHDPTRHLFSEAPAYVYQVPLLYDEGIPADLGDRDFSRRDFVQVPVRYHADRPETLIVIGTHAHPVYGGAFATPWVTYRPGKVAEYYLADDRFFWLRADWQRYVPTPESPQNRIIMRTTDAFPEAEAGSRRPEERRFEGPLIHGVAEASEQYRELIGRDDRFDVPDETVIPATMARGGAENDQFFPPFCVTGNSGLHRYACPGAGNAFGTTWRMWNEDTGEELDLDTVWFRPAFDGLAAEKATYRLEQTDAYPSWMEPYFRTKTAATTTWTFGSEASDATVPEGYKCWVRTQSECQIQPLIQLQYGLELDVHNRAPAGRVHKFTIQASHHDEAVNAAPVTDMTVKASFDGGQTWNRAWAFRWPWYLPGGGDDVYKVMVLHPRLADTDGFVSLRVEAEDANGGTVEQVIERAYILK